MPRVHCDDRGARRPFQRGFGRGAFASVGAGLLGIATTVSANPAHEFLLKLSEAERNEKLTESMRDGGESCRVVRTFFRSMDAKGDALWDVACSNKKSCSVMIHNDSVGSTKILECGVLKLSQAAMGLAVGETG